ncbi:MAG: HNH endonuclease [Krumholzibacteria bacterium]|nr:HNH endonuclease [Candidatus Krumholzibacteria bacterium]
MLTEFAPGRPAREADSALKSASSAEAAARQCAVLWFGEILARGLHRELGYASMQQYARVELGYSETRISDFMRLVQALERLPAMKEALPEIGYTKIREIIQVASPRTEEKWVEEARTSTRAQLVQKVKRVRARATAKPAASLFAPPADETVLAAEVPVRVSVEFTPEQHARWEALWEQVRKRGANGDRAELLLEALQVMASSECSTTNNVESFPRGKSDPNVHIHVHQCPDCGQVEANGRPLGRANAERVQCDAVVSTPGKRATATIAPRIRREVLARDRHRCQAPGCGRTRFLEVHHKKPRARGGAHEPANLVTLCASCHRLWHERR